jgi:hypothetical protein
MSNYAEIINLVIGVHRSGTSLLTQGLVEAGARLGNFSDSFDLDNPRGYFEHKEVVRFNERLLSHLGVSWDNWGFRASELDIRAPALATWREEAADILRAAFVGSGPFILKDPRIASLASFWERVVPDAGFKLRRILILRDPAEVAESQRQRVVRRPLEFPVIADVEPMAALWAVTMSEVLGALSDDETLLVSHASLLTDPVPTLSTAAAFAGLSTNPREITRFAAEGVKKDLYRSRPPTDQSARGAWMNVAQALFNDLIRAGTPRQLSMAEARAIGESQRELSSLLLTLSAVRPTITRMQLSQKNREQQQQRQQEQLAALASFIWAIAPLGGYAPKPMIRTAIERSWQLAEESDLAKSSFAFSHTLGRLLLVAGGTGEALAWLDRIRTQFGHAPAYLQLEQEVLKLPNTQAERPP